MFESRRVATESIMSFIYLVYGWMALALSITAAISYYISTNPAIYSYLFSSPGLPMLLFIAQLGLVIALSAMINRLSYTAAVVLFILYAAMLGITLSTIFFVYTSGSIYATFFVTAGTFGIMAVYGFVTKTDLTAIGSFCLMALLGLIVGSLVNMFLQNQVMDYVLSAVGVLLFTALTAYDMQKIKQLAYNDTSDENTRSKLALLGALTLYLDFVNLFLYMLKFMGKKKD